MNGLRLGLLVLLGIGAVPMANAAEVEILGCEPARTESLLVCTLATRGLPGVPSRETLASGLPSALIVALSLLDDSGEELGRTVCEIRIEPDLWEQVFFIRTPLRDSRYDSLPQVASALDRLGPLPVLPIEDLAGDRSLRVRSRLAIHPLAPQEILRVQALFAGQSGESGESDDQEPDRRETSIGLGSLLRFFIGGDPDEDWVAESISRRFTVRSLAAAK